MTPWKAGCPARLSVLFSIPPKAKASWQEEGDELTPNMEWILLSLAGSTFCFIPRAQENWNGYLICKSHRTIIKCGHGLEGKSHSCGSVVLSVALSLLHETGVRRKMETLN